MTALGLTSVSGRIAIIKATENGGTPGQRPLRAHSDEPDRQGTATPRLLIAQIGGRPDLSGGGRESATDSVSPGQPRPAPLALGEKSYRESYRKILRRLPLLSQHALINHLSQESEREHARERSEDRTCGLPAWRMAEWPNAKRTTQLADGRLRLVRVPHCRHCRRRQRRGSRASNGASMS